MEPKEIEKIRAILEKIAATPIDKHTVEEAEDGGVSIKDAMQLGYFQCYRSFHQELISLLLS